ncbi:MAG: putative tellurite resistance protein B-like protein, partial [bacterium]
VFPDVLRHALGIRTQIPQDNAPSLIEMMKVAWTLDMAERVIEADGYAHDTELDILQRTFSPRRLGALGLIDRASCVRLRTLARIELATLTTLHEKHSLLGLLFRIAQADGKVVATELAVLKLAADELDVPWENAQQYMLQQWG